MHKVLQLYNILGALPERVWLEYPTALADRYAMTLGYETLSADAPRIDLPTVQLARVSVEATQDIAEEARRLNAPAHPAWKLLRENFRLVHGHTGPRLLHAMPFLMSDVPVVLSLYGYDASRLLRDPSWAARYRFAGESGATLVTLCQAMTDRLIGCGVPSQSVRMIRLGLHLDRWRYAPTPASAAPRFVFVGRLAPKKGVADLLRALGMLGERNCTLDVIGDGPLEDELKSLAAELGLSSLVQFHGKVQRERIGTFLAEATALVLPSVTAPDGDAEGTPIVLMEAQAVGVPCVTTRHAGNPDVLPADSPLLAEEGNPASLAAALQCAIRMSSGERSLLQNAGRERIETQFDLRQTVAQYARLYGERIGSIVNG